MANNKSHIVKNPAAVHIADSLFPQCLRACGMSSFTESADMMPATQESRVAINDCDTEPATENAANMNSAPRGSAKPESSATPNAMYFERVA